MNLKHKTSRIFKFLKNERKNLKNPKNVGTFWSIDSIG